MTVAAAGAIAIGAAEEAAVVIFLFAVGELLETVAAGRARAGIKALINLVPRTARIEEAGQVREVPVERLRVGDIVDRSSGRPGAFRRRGDRGPVRGRRGARYRRVGPGREGRRRSSLRRQHQCERHAARSAHAHRRRQHDRAHHSPGRRSARIEGADRPFHRSVLGLLHAGRHGGGSPDHRRAAARRRRRLVHLDLSRIGDAAHRLPLCACDLDAGGNRLWSCIRRSPRASHQGRSSPGNPRQSHDHRLRQDRHPHDRKAAGDRHRCDRGNRGRRSGESCGGRAWIEPSAWPCDHRGRRGAQSRDPAGLRRLDGNSGQGSNRASA